MLATLFGIEKMVYGPLCPFIRVSSFAQRILIHLLLTLHWQSNGMKALLVVGSSGARWAKQEYTFGAIERATVAIASHHDYAAKYRVYEIFIRCVYLCLTIRTQLCQYMDIRSLG